MISFCGLDASSDHHKTAFVQLCRDILEVERNGMHEKASVLLLQHIMPVYAAGATVAKRSNVILSHGLGFLSTRDKPSCQKKSFLCLLAPFKSACKKVLFSFLSRNSLFLLNN